MSKHKKPHSVSGVHTGDEILIIPSAYGKRPDAPYLNQGMALRWKIVSFNKARTEAHVRAVNWPSGLYWVAVEDIWKGR